MKNQFEIENEDNEWLDDTTDNSRFSSNNFSANEELNGDNDNADYDIEDAETEDDDIILNDEDELESTTDDNADDAPDFDGTRDV